MRVVLGCGVLVVDFLFPSCIVSMCSHSGEKSRLSSCCGMPYIDPNLCRSCSLSDVFPMFVIWLVVFLWLKGGLWSCVFCLLVSIDGCEMCTL